MSTVRLAVLLTILMSDCAFADIENMEVIGKGEVRYLGMIKIYDAVLYAEGSPHRDHILSGETSKCLKILYNVALTVKDFTQGAETILQRQHSREYLDVLQPLITTMHQEYRDVKSGDSYTLCYNALEKRTTLSLNNDALVSVVSSDFGSLYFGIWLGPVSPFDETLRDNLLGNANNRKGMTAIK